LEEVDHAQPKAGVLGLSIKQRKPPHILDSQELIQMDEKSVNIRLGNCYAEAYKQG